MRRPDTYSVSVGPAAYEYAKRVAEQTMRDNAKLGLTFEELAVALVLRGVALSAQAEPQPRRTRGYLGATVDGGIDDHDEPPAAPPASEPPVSAYERECDDADAICAALGLTVEQARTEGGSLNVPRIVAHINETLTALRESHAFGVAMADKYITSQAKTSEPQAGPCCQQWATCTQPCVPRLLHARHDEPQAEPPADALVERLRDAGAGEESGSHTHRAIFDAIDRIAALTAERDEQHRLAVKRWDDMCAYADRVTAAESALATANERAEGMRVAVQRLLDAKGRYRTALAYAELVEHLAALARKEGE